MSHHMDERNTPELDDLLRLHSMATDTPSQLSDAFRLGYWAAQAEISRLQADVERLRATLEANTKANDAIVSELLASEADAHNAAIDAAAECTGNTIIKAAIRALKRQ